MWIRFGKCRLYLVDTIGIGHIIMLQDQCLPTKFLTTQKKGIMKHGMHTLLIATLITTFTACSKDKIKGEGPTIIDTRTLQAFNTVDVAGSTSVEVVKSAEYKVEISGYENLVPIYQTRVNGNILTLGYDENDNVRNDNVQVKVFTPDFKQAVINGSVSFTVGDGFNPATMQATMNGSCQLTVGHNTVDNLFLVMYGSCRADAQKTVAKLSDIDISGSGKALVTSLEKLDVRISGSGEVHYWGDPGTVDVDISGSGKAIKH